MIGCRVFKRILLALLFISCNTFSQSLQFITLADLHVNTALAHRMQIDAKGYRSKNDLDKATFLSLLQLIKHNIKQGVIPKNPDFVLLLGDLVGHRAYLKGKRSVAVKHNLLVALQSLQQLFPNKPIISVFGNNDSSQKNYGRYFYKGHSPYKTALAAGYKNGFISTGNRCQRHAKSKVPCLISGDKKNGYFSVLIKPHLVLLGINSVMFSPKHKTPATVTAKQMHFISATLAAAKKQQQSVLIAMHIPVGVNMYNGDVFWRQALESQFLGVLHKYRSIIRGVLVGHTHLDEVKVLKLGGKPLGQYYTPALSTSHGNSPGLRVYTMQKKQQHWYIEDYETFQIHGQKTPRLTSYYHFKRSYCKNIATNNINDCLNNVPTKLLWKHYTVGNPNHFMTKIHDAGAAVLKVIFPKLNPKEKNSDDGDDLH